VSEDPFALFVRDALPDEIAVLRRAHPRPTWPAHPNLGAMAAFWLQRHGLFRALGTALAEGGERLREGEVGAREFWPWFAPRVSTYLGELHTHHHVEDHHYFPIFRAADARLARGFDLLDADHGALDGLIQETAREANALFAALQGPGDPVRAGDSLADRLSRMLAGLTRHLDDEEDLVVPLILERGEDALGVG